MVKAGILLCLFVVASNAAMAAPSDSGDSLNEALASNVCTDLGDSCAKYKAECSSSALPNTCLVSIYFELEVAKERCGKSNYISCFEENNEYKKKWMLDLNIPNMANPKHPEAIRFCEKQSRYHVKSKRLKKLASAIARATGDSSPYYYMDNKAFYACFKKHLK